MIRRVRIAGGAVVAAMGIALLAAACNTTNGEVPQAGATLPRGDDAPSDAGVSPPADAASDGNARGDGPSNLRVMAANLSSGSLSTYEPGEGTRMFQGLRPDVALVQELKYRSNTDEDLRAFVTDAFGAEYTYFVESNVNIPNAIVTRYPILESGRWDDPQLGDRNFVYAKIDVPGEHALWAVSVHLHTKTPESRNVEARTLVDALKGVVANDDFIVIAGDFNTDDRNEECLSTFGELVNTAGPYPRDENGEEDTNANRNKPYDWVMSDGKLGALQVPTVIGEKQFAAGLVFDSRVFQPLASVAPIRQDDSDAVNMQHMPVVKDFHLPE